MRHPVGGALIAISLGLSLSPCARAADGLGTPAALRETRGLDVVQPLAVKLETPYFGYTYYVTPNGSRFFAARLHFANPNSHPITIRPRDIVLTAERTRFKLKEIPLNLRSQSFHVGGKVFDLSKPKPMTDLTVPAHGSAEKWVVFTGIPAGVQVPALVLQITAADKVVEIDVNDFTRRLMGLTVERIGPRGCVALLTVSGKLDTINIGALTSTLEAMVEHKVMRSVIRFTKTASPLEGAILSWLQQSAYFAGRGEHANQQMPAFPMAIRELHLAGVPNRGAHLEGSFGSRPRIHKTDVEAVRAALQTAIDVLPRDEVLAEIEKGHPLSRLAALTAGGGRLSASDLPLVLNFADDADPRTQQAALTALRHFGDSPAIEKLLAYARKNSEPTASIAIESLAASRYAAAHEGLLEVLQKEHPASRRLIVRILAKYPRPIWSDTIYSFVTDSEPEVAVEALRALVQVGHPRLFEVLKESLSRSSPVVRDEAFRLLSMRNDPQSEMLALNFALQTMQTGIPTPAMYDLLNRTKDARAIPVLLAQLDRSSRNRSQIIATLAQIGDQTVSDALVQRYSNFDNREKTAALNALQQLKSRSFRELAGEALKQSDAPLFAAAVSGLQNDGSPRAVELLVAALESSTNSTAWTNLTVALSSFGTPEAKAALNAARNATNPTKRELANTALQMLRRRSPGFSYCIQARQAVAIEKWDEAIARYTSAIEVDPDLPEAYSGRGHAYLQQKQTAKARKDFAKAIDLDAFSPEAVTGLGICLVQDGQIPQGIKVIEDSRARMNNDALYAYNAGCVYGRALQHLLKQRKSAERDKNVAHYQAKALADLRHSTKLGFTEFDWMKKDPDLESLHDLKEFKKIASQEDSEEEAPEEKSSENGQADDKKAVDDKKTKARAGAAAAEKATTVEAFKIDWLFENAQP